MFFVSCTNETTGAASDGQSENANKSSSSTRTWTDSLTGMEFIWIPGECFDMGQSETEATELKKNPAVLEGGSNRMLRGGDWASLPVIARSAGRMNSPPNWSYNITGFRLKRVP